MLRRESLTHELQQISDITKNIDPTLRQNFTQLYKAWVDTWSQAPFCFSSNTHDLMKSPAYPALRNLGPAMLPLVIELLATDPNQNFVANVIYDDLIV